jgi:HAD superfamily hydrolase (TIGR01509 family)
MIKAVIFDMNGVIIDDEHIHELAFQETVKRYNIDLSHEDYLECCAGKTDYAGYKEIASKFTIHLNVDKLLNEKSQAYLNLFPTNKKKYPGVINLIRLLSKDFILALTSSSSKAEVDLIIKEFDIQEEFQVTISADDVTKGKPNPEPYLTTAEKLSLSPYECVAIEDSKSGVISAKSAGCYCIGIITTHHKSDLEQSDLIVHDFSEISTEVIGNLR